VTSELERLERESKQPPRTPRDFDAVRQKAATSPGDLTDLDIQTISYFGGRHEAADAVVARSRAQLRSHGRATLTEEKHIGEMIASVIKAILGAELPHRDAQIVALERRIVELEARPVVRDAGIWEAGREYRSGDIVTHHGAGWICRATHVSVGTSPQHDAFRMFVKSNR
jgi:hypothetical protein